MILSGESVLLKTLHLFHYSMNAEFYRLQNGTIMLTQLMRQCNFEATMPKVIIVVAEAALPIHVQWETGK